jgi:mRNA interferase RelE/StbE
LTFEVLLHPRAARFLERLDPALRSRIVEHLRELSDSPQQKGERLMQSPFWRLRVGDYRAIYEIHRDGSTVIVLFIGQRRDVYDDFSRLL